MTTKAGAGYSENPKSRDAGIEAATSAMKDAGVDECDLALLYSTSKHDPVVLRDGVRSVIGNNARLAGGYAIGTFTRDHLGYEGFQVGVAVFRSDTVRVDMFIEKGLPDNEFNVGKALGLQINSKQYVGTPNIVFMYDSIKGKPPEGVAFNMNLGTPLIEGMGRSLGKWPPAAGVGMFGDWQSNPTYQWFDNRIEQQSALAVVFHGGVHMDTIIMHGCKPSSGYHTITKAEHNVVLEIDGKRAVDVVAELLGDSFKSWEEYPFFVTLGLNKGNLFGEFNEEEYANRLVMGVDKARGGLMMFEPDLKSGSEVQLMRRSIDFKYIGERVEDLMERVGSRKPFFALYIDCAGRASAYSGTEGEEAEAVQKAIGERMPLLGMYSGVELAKVGTDMQALDWTGVLCVFSE
jgi:hypothetical protein